MGRQHFIELNGKRYDAVTGVLIPGQATTPAMALKSLPYPGNSIDGFIRSTRPAEAVLSPKKITTPAATHKDPAKISKSRYIKPKPLAAHRPEKPKTLMRQAVHKPSFHIKPALKVQLPVEVSRPKSSILAPKLSASRVNPNRLNRAKRLPRSGLVRHFGAPAESARTLAEGRAQSRVAASPTPGAHPKLSASSEVEHFPARGSFEARSRSTIAHSSRPTRLAAASSAEPENIFENAIAHATSHQQAAPTRHRPHRRWLNITAGVVAFLLLSCAATYVNRANLQMHIASFHAGFSARLPAYQPTGYQLSGHINQQHGTVSVSFRSGDSSYTLTQQPSDWDSATLHDSIVAVGEKTKTLQRNGRIIYITDKAATWVSNGIHYQITGNAQLSTDEISAIASSI
jgi:Domain of unknown function (DUF4367)